MLDSAPAADLRHMGRALELAARAEGFTAPNPMVGAVVVKDGAVIGEGWHRGPGQPHAEVEALRAAGEAARGACVYVTLEPCNHYGRTPPCVSALIASGVAEVVFALADPNPVAAGGAAALQRAGLRVRGGVCEAEARALNRFWLHALTASRPYVIAKFAASLDGRIATRTGESQWITGPEARRRAHDLRQAADAVIVGAGTILADDPALTARPEGREPAHPLRVVLDSAGRTPPGARAFDRAGPGAMIVTTPAMPGERRSRYEALGVEVFTTDPDGEGRADLAATLRELKTRGMNAVLIEGGAGVLGSAFDAGLVDEVWAFLAPIIIGGEGRPAVAGLGAGALAEALRLEEVAMEMLGADILVRGLIRGTPRRKDAR